MSSAPRREFRIQSPLAPAELLNVLAAATEEPRWIHWSHRHRLFQGKIDRARFEVRRIVHDRNSIRPRIVGEIVQGEHGTSVVGVMCLARWVRPFLVFWTSMVGMALVATILFQVLARQFTLFGTIIPLAMLAFGVATLRGLPRDFLAETEEEMRYLAELVDAATIEWNRDEVWRQTTSLLN